MGVLLGIWIGSTLTAWGYVRRHTAVGAVAHFKGWEWLGVPYYVAVWFWQTRPWRKTA